MKYLLFALLTLLASCTFTVQDTRTEPERAATATAKAIAPLPPLDELGGTLRIVLEKPPIDIAPQVMPTVALPTVTPSPACLNVKGNISRDGRRLYHLPGMRNYDQVVIDEAAGERIFCSEQDAIDAGFTKAGN